MTEQPDSALEALRWHWGSAYRIARYGEEWAALRKDGRGGRIEASTPEELNRLIASDYALLPVPRDICP